jgi:hypothetical protein
LWMMSFPRVPSGNPIRAMIRLFPILLDARQDHAGMTIFFHAPG